MEALRNQVQESEACILAQRWRLVDRYVESKSGTTTKGRDEYNRLYEDLLSDRFDVIVIKSQDRLMRNVKDWYLFLDRMQRHGKRLRGLEPPALPAAHQKAGAQITQPRRPRRTLRRS